MRSTASPAKHEREHLNHVLNFPTKDCVGCTFYNHHLSQYSMSDLSTCSRPNRTSEWAEIETRDYSHDADKRCGSKRKFKIRKGEEHFATIGMSFYWEEKNGVIVKLHVKEDKLYDPNWNPMEEVYKKYGVPSGRSLFDFLTSNRGESP